MKKKLHKLFGASRLSLEQARRSLETLLGLQFELHESLYFGGDYFRFEVGDLTLTLRPNFIDEDGERAEPLFPNEPVLLYFDCSAENMPAAQKLALLSGSSETFPILRDDSR